LADIRGDVAFSKFRKHHKGFQLQGTLGHDRFPPTSEARHFVEHWRNASDCAPYGEIDQSSQFAAMAKAIGTSFVPLPLTYCVDPDEKGRVPGVVVQHDSAAVNFPKVSGWRRYVRRMMGTRAA
jgi:hypothetical protein